MSEKIGENYIRDPSPVCFLSSISRGGGEATQRTATPCTSVRFRPPSPFSREQIVLEILFLVAIMLLPMITGAYTFYKSYQIVEERNNG